MESSSHAGTPSPEPVRSQLSRPETDRQPGRNRSPATLCPRILTRRKNNALSVMVTMILRSDWWREFRQVDDPPGGGGDGDGDLVATFQRSPASAAGRQAASHLLDRYRQRVLVWCWRVIGDREAALDLSQEVLLKAYSRLADYEHDGRFGAWLFTIARNVVRDWLRHKKVAERVRIDGDAVECETSSAGKRTGSSGAKIGNAHLKWAFSEAAEPGLRPDPVPGERLEGRREGEPR